MPTTRAIPNIPVATADYAQAAALLKLASEPSRIRVLLALKDGPLTGPDLAGQLPAEGLASLPLHLRLLRASGLITATRKWPMSVYQIEVKGSKALAVIEGLIALRIA